MAHPFICPNCGHRTTELDRNIGFTRQRKGCAKCGFAFLFELLDDYYPAPDAAFFVCDGEGRVVGCGKNSFAFTGVEEEEVIGQRVEEVLGLSFVNGEDPVATVLEWGVRALGRFRCRSRASATWRPPPRRTSSRPMTTTAACCLCSPPTSSLL